MKFLKIIVVTFFCMSPPLVAQDIAEPFEDVSRAAGITAAHRGEWSLFDPRFNSGYLGIGQAWGDYDNDGWIDLFVTGNLESDVLYRNQGDGHFIKSEFSSQVSQPAVLSGGAVWADYDNDGWKDLYVVNHGANALFHNNGRNGFTNLTEAAGVGDAGKGTTATWGDYDGDGDLDLYVANWSCFPECGDPPENDLGRDTLYRNNNDGTFDDVSYLLAHNELLGSAFAASFSDYDNDGDQDIYVVNDMFKNPIGNILWRNDGPGCEEWCWSEVSVEAGANTYIHGMGLAIGDYDNDLDLDFYFSDMVNRMALLQNQGDGMFVDKAREAGVAVGPSSAVGWGTIFFDYDNDSWLDLYLTTTEFIQYDVYSGPIAMLAEFPDFLFKNAADGTFIDETPASWLEQPRPSMGVAYADYDNDGRVDFVVGHWNEGYTLFRNTSRIAQNHNWLTVRLTGGGRVNRDAVGAKVFVTTSAGNTTMQVVKNGSSLGAGNDLALHFGLGSETIEHLRVVWPDGSEDVIDDVTINQILSIHYLA